MSTREGFALCDVLDHHTDGGLYALQYEAEQNGWDSHIWVQKLGDGVTRFFFYATDWEGRTRYFDHASAKDTGDLGDKLLIYERMVEIKKAKARIRDGLARLDQGLDPVPHQIDTKTFD